jgi:hypothetical protein
VEFAGDLAETELYSHEPGSGGLGGTTGTLVVQQCVKLLGWAGAFGSIIDRADWTCEAVGGWLDLKHLMVDVVANRHKRVCFLLETDGIAEKDTSQVHGFNDAGYKPA